MKQPHYSFERSQIVKQLVVLCIVLGVAATTLTRLWAERPEPEEQLILSIRLLDKPGSDGKARVLAQSKVATPFGIPFSPWQGTKYKSQTGGADLESGEGVSGKLTQRPDGRVHLAMTFRRSTHVNPPANTDTDVVRIEALAIQCFLQPGVVKKIDCSNSQTCELRLEKK